MIWQAYSLRNRWLWQAVGPVCFSKEEAEGYAESHVKWRLSEGAKRPTILIREVEHHAAPSSQPIRRARPAWPV